MVKKKENKGKIFSFLSSPSWFFETLYIKITREEIPSNIQTKDRLTSATKNKQKIIKTLKNNRSRLVVEKNSTIKRETRAVNPVKIPKLFHEPKRVSVLVDKIPKEKILGKKICNVWKTKVIIADNIKPNKSILAFFGVLKTIEDKNIKRKPEKMNQKDWTSNIVPNKETPCTLETRAETRVAKTTKKPPNKHTDSGKTIFPSKNLAKLQNITVKRSANTKRKPLEISIGILVKGKKKNGNKTTKETKEINESLSNKCERIEELYYRLIKKCNINIL